MSRNVRQRTYLLLPLILAVFTGCQDTTEPLLKPRLPFAQGDNGVWTVNSLGDPGVGVCDDTECTLREAIAAADSAGKIVFENGLQGDVLLTAGPLGIHKDLTIDGADRIAVDAQRNSSVIIVSGGPD